LSSTPSSSESGSSGSLDDDDGVEDESDTFPLDPDETSDADGDGVKGVGVLGYTRKAKFQARIYNAETGKQRASAYYPMF